MGGERAGRIEADRFSKPMIVANVDWHIDARSPARCGKLDCGLSSDHAGDFSEQGRQLDCRSVVFH